MATWTPDTKGESLAAELGIMLSPINQRHPISKIKVTQGLRNQARLDAPLDPATVADYINVLDTGGKLPAIFLTDDGQVVAGNHRLGAAIRKGLLTIGAYTMTLPAKDGRKALELFKRRDNITHGRRVSKEDRLLHCVFCVKELHMAPSELVGQFNMSAAKINAGVRADDAKALVRKNKIDVDWSLATFDALNSLHDDKLAVRVAGLGAAHDLSQAAVTDLIKDVKAKRTHDARTRVIERWEESIGRANHTANGSSRKRSRTRRKTEAELYLERAKLEFLHPRGFKAFILCGNKAAGGKPFQSLEEMGVTDPGDIANISDSLNELIQALTTLKRGKK